MLKKIKSELSLPDNKKLLSNFISLSVLQVVGFVLPILVIPYLIIVLGVEKFGLVAFAQAFMTYFVVFTDYGFNLSATRDISIHRDNNLKISSTKNSVIIKCLPYEDFPSIPCSHSESRNRPRR